MPFVIFYIDPLTRKAFNLISFIVNLRKLFSFIDDKFGVSSSSEIQRKALEQTAPEET